MTRINYRVTLDLDETVGTTQAVLTALREYKEKEGADEYQNFLAALNLCIEDTTAELEKVSGTTVELSDFYFENGYDLTDYEEVYFI
jgi:hypothetical protein